MLAFGPVPSRRLGRSLGINNIPPKICTYACVYCQIGKTTRMQTERSQFYDPERIYAEVRKQVENARQKGESIDYLTFVPDGEPTLDANLGQEIDLLKSLGLKIAVITNGSLIWRGDVRTDLAKADWVSVKIDSIQKKIWHRINRPCRNLKLASILDGMVEFAKIYAGELVTETMLVHGLNTESTMLKKLANLLALVTPTKVFLAIPTRPPAEHWVQSPSPDDLLNAFQIFKDRIHPVEYLIGYEGNNFAATENPTDDLLNITAVHPMRADAIDHFLFKTEQDWSLVHSLIANGYIIESVYKGCTFYLRNFERNPSR